MQESIDSCLDCFKTLKVYIEDAFPDNLQKAKLDAAGQGYFPKAQSYNRDAVSNLNDCATQFILNNFAPLQANENMPNTFLAAYLDAKKEFDNRQQKYIESTSEAKEKQTENTTANNDIYRHLMTMCKDAQRVFAKDDNMSRFFTFSYLLSRVSGYSVAGLRGVVTKTGDNTPIVGATVSINGKNKTVVTDETGKYDVPQLASGLYSITISAEGCKDMTVDNYEVKASVYNRLDVAMEAVAAAKLVLAEA
jgi:hypothetical protein